MDINEFQVSSKLKIEDCSESDEVPSAAMEFVEIEGFHLVDQTRIQCKTEVGEAEECENSADIISNLQTKLKEISQKSVEEGFMIQITDQEYLAIGERKIFFLARLTKLVQSYCGKSLRLYKVCNGCGFKAIQEKDMDIHFEGGPCDTYHHALESFNKPIFMLQCGTCLYRTNVRHSLLRHQEKRGHSGIEKVRVDSQPAEEADGSSIIIVDNAQEIITNLRSKLEQEAQNCKDDFLIPISKEELDAISKKRNCLKTNLSKVVRSVCNKDVKHFQVCDNCGFKTSIVKNMERHLEHGPCIEYFDALGTCPVRNRRVQVLQCNTCDFKTEHIGNIQRHLIRQGHDGFVKSKPARSGEQSADQSEDESNSASKPKRKMLDQIIPCRQCGQQMQSSNHKRHLQLYCSVLHKKPAKIGTGYDLPVDEHGSPVMKCQDCGKRFSQYYYLERHAENGCPILRKLEKEAGSGGQQQKRKYQRTTAGVRQMRERELETRCKLEEEDPLKCEVKVELE